MCVWVAVALALAGAAYGSGVLDAAAGGRPPRSGVIAFETLSGLYVVAARDGRPRKIAGTLPGDGNPVWSPDGRRLAFERQREGDWDIYVMNADGSGQKRLTFSPADDDFARWAPHGRSLVFQSTRRGSAEIYAIDVATRAARRVTGPGEYPDWMQDGRILFTDEGGLHTVRPYGADRRALRTQLSDVVAGQVSNDGRRIVYIHGGGLSIARVDGSHARALTFDPADDDATWSPDDAWIAYDRGYGSIYTIRADGTGQSTLTSTRGGCCPDWAGAAR